MNLIKAEKQIFNAIVNGDRVCFFRLDESHVFVTPDGFMGYVFPIIGIHFDVTKCMEMQPLKIAEAIKPENELFLTQDFRCTDYRCRKMYRRMTAPGKNVFVRNSFLNNFQNARFWQEKDNPNALITVTERTSTQECDAPFPVGVMLPLRAGVWADDAYYKDML